MQYAQNHKPINPTHSSGMKSESTCGKPQTAWRHSPLWIGGPCRIFFPPNISQHHFSNTSRIHLSSTSPNALVLTSIELWGGDSSSISLLHLFKHLLIQQNASKSGANLAELESTGALSYIQLGEVPFGPGTRHNQTLGGVPPATHHRCIQQPTADVKACRCEHLYSAGWHPSW